MLCPKMTADCEERHLRIAVKKEVFTTRAVGNYWDALEQKISMASINREIRFFGLRSCWPFLYPPLTPIYCT